MLPFSDRGDAMILLLALLLAAPLPKRELLSAGVPLMGTELRVTLLSRDTPAAREAIRDCFRLFERVDQVMSEWKPDSPLSELNRRAGERPVALPRDLLRLLVTAVWVADQTDGAFDPTWAALWGLWKFSGEPRVPAREEILERLPLVGYRNLELDLARGTAFLPRKGMAVGLGAIGKGYALQIAPDALRAAGFTDFLLYAGGQIYAAGAKEDGPWTTGVQDPRGPAGDVFATLPVKDASVSTSGDYEHAFVKDGVVYHHIIDLRTGMPSRGVRSATVMAANATLADAWSTSAFLLGAEGGMALARRMGFELLLVDDAGRMHMTESMRARLKIRHQPAKSGLPSGASR